ncbi:MAG TPA: hypothetical protein VL049_08110 [Candidatus Dormibacteraeota bacterium]|nr:hypothetical protein [Candidatus Dormibacteraeota bacterium]
MATTASGRRGGGGVPHMWTHAAQDQLLAPDPALPAQVLHLWHHSRSIAPERALALAVLVQAVADIQRFRESGLLHHRGLHDEAAAWIRSEARAWPFAFANLCDAFALDIGEVRAALLGAGGARQAA